MSGEGKVVTENADRVVNTEMGNDRHVLDKEAPGPRGSKAPVDNPVLCGVPVNDSHGAASCAANTSEDSHGAASCAANTSEEEQGNNISDNGDHEKLSVDDFPVPGNELRNKIMKQGEFYFSDANILKDQFLLKHVRRNKIGYVSIKLIASFKKMKRLSTDVRVIVYSLRHSEELEVNENGTKVRRRKPIPEYDESTPSRTVVAVNLAQKKPTVESVTQDFSNCGEIALVRILHPGQNIPPDINKYARKHPEIGRAVCAVIEFNKQEDAIKACKTMTNTEDWRSGMRVVLLSKARNQKEKPDGKKDDSNTENDAPPKEGGGAEDTKKKKNALHRKKKHADQQPEEKNSHCSSSDGDGTAVPCTNGQRSSNGSGGSQSNHTSPHSSPGPSPHNQHHRKSQGKFPLADMTAQNGMHLPNHRKSPETYRPKRNCSEGKSSASGSSPWVQRRLRAAQDSKLNASVMSSVAAGQCSADGLSTRNSKVLDKVGVLRLPKGPDGSKGFYGGLGRGKPRCNTIE